MKLLFTLLSTAFITFGAAQAQDCGHETIETSIEKPTRISSGDFDGDGNTDIIMLDSLSFYVGWKRGLGASEFADYERLAGGPEIEHLQVADFTNDNYDEIIIATAGLVYTLQYQAITAGVTQFAIQEFESAAAPLGMHITGLKTADFNNDGAHGFAIGYSSTSDFGFNILAGVFYNEANSFGYTTLMEGDFGAISDIAVGDITGDGKPDVAIAGYSNFWFKNLTGTTFSDDYLISSAVSDFGKVQLMNIDNDSNMELVSIKPNGDLIDYEVDPTGEFGSFGLTITSGLTGNPSFYQKGVYDGNDVLIIQDGDELAMFRKTGGSLTKTVVCNSVSSLGGATLIETSNSNSDLYFTQTTAGKISRFTNGVGIEENETSQISVHPNPSSDFIQIESPHALEQVWIVNTLGQRTNLEATISMQYNIQNLPAGVYQLIVVDKNGNQSTSPFVKQ